MKWLCYLILMCYFIYKLVYGAVQDDLIVKKDDDSTFWNIDSKHKISCRGTKNAKLHWENPQGKLIKDRYINNRVYVEKIPHKSLATELVLVIDRVYINDTGVWVCRSGSAIETVEVCVIKKGNYMNSPVNINVNKGGSISLSCTSQYGMPEPEIIWHRNGKILTDYAITNASQKYMTSIKYNIYSKEGLLTILDLSSDDEGTYTCEAVQGFEENDFCFYNESLNIHLNVNYAPIMLYEPDVTKFIFASNNSFVYMECHADSYPPPNYVWYQQYSDRDREIPKNMITTNNSVSILVIYANETAFRNIYKCQASNPYGMATSVFMLLPKLPPTTPDKLIFINSSDSTITFSIHWDNKGNPFQLAEIEIMYIKSSEVSKHKVRQIFWKTATTTSVIIENNETLPFITNQDIEVNISKLDANTEYWLRSRAINDEGVSDWSKPILVSTIDEKDVTTELEKREFKKHETIYCIENNNHFIVYGIMGSMLVITFLCVICVKTI